MLLTRGGCARSGDRIQQTRLGTLPGLVSYKMLAFFVLFCVLNHFGVSTHDVPHFVSIPSGHFLMGTSDTTPLPAHVSGNQPNRVFGSYDERPVTKQSVDAFEMSTTEITNAMYEKYDPSHKLLRGKLYFSYDDDEAAIWVSWYNASSYAAWLTESRNDGYTYRLPTEVEWEYACRAGTSTPYNTGNKFPKSQRKNNDLFSHSGNPESDWPNVQKDQLSKLHVALFQPNAFGLYDMHGNVEEWTSSTYKKYGNDSVSADVMDQPIYVSRGGSHGTALYFLRSAARFGAPPFANSMVIGFRVVREKNGIERQELVQDVVKTTKKTATTSRERRILSEKKAGESYFRFIQYVNIPHNQTKFPYGQHNHDPAITVCPDGSILSIFFSTWREKDREQGLAFTRLSDPQNGTWSTPEAFYNIPNRATTGPAFLQSKNGTLYQWMAVSPWESNKGTQVYQRESTDCGRTWSVGYSPQGLNMFGGHSPAETALELSDGVLLLPTDDDGKEPEPKDEPRRQKLSGQTSRFCLSSDGGQTWTNPAGTIRGHHGAFVELHNGSIWGIGRDDGLVGKDGLLRMAQGLTNDRGNSFSISATMFPDIHSGQRMVALRLQEGPILVLSFANGKRGVPSVIETRYGKEIFGLFAAVSFDEASTFAIVRLVSDDSRTSHDVQSTDGHIFQMNQTHAEPMGYISAIQDQKSGMIHAITSRQHYQFNYAWLMAGKG